MKLAEPLVSVLVCMGVQEDRFVEASTTITWPLVPVRVNPNWFANMPTLVAFKVEVDPHNIAGTPAMMSNPSRWFQEDNRLWHWGWNIRKRSHLRWARCLQNRSPSESRRLGTRRHRCW